MKYTKQQITEFLQQSNYIENELSNEALEDAEKAFEYANKYKHNFVNQKVSINYILNIHKILLKRLRVNIAGKFRACDVYIGGELKMYINDTYIPDVIKGWMNTININEVKKLSKKTKIEKIKECHIGFEKIHPFEDGNGRVGRLLYLIHTILLDLPIYIIKNDTKYENYYKWFK